MNIVPEKGINFSVYLDGQDMLGVAEGELSNLGAMTSEVKGAGIAGVADTIVLGHFNSLGLSLTWRNTTRDFARLAAHVTHNLDLYAAHQDYNAGLGMYVEKSIHYFVKAIPKTSTLGNLVVGDGTGTKTEFEVVYLKLEIDGVEKIELDKFNYIYKVEGVDYLAGVRAALGKM